jgi:sugar lactone lactonase YvrE
MRTIQPSIAARSTQAKNPLDTPYTLSSEGKSEVELREFPAFPKKWSQPFSFEYFARKVSKGGTLQPMENASTDCRDFTKTGARGVYPLAVAAALLFTLTASSHAQGILTVTPSRTTTTTAGTGTVGYTGDTGAATAATLSNPSAVAYDANGNLYLADANNHVIREVSAAGVITTIAGTGIEGYSGDGATATAAQLDTPTGIAVDASGNVYIADSHNHRIREVSGGNITTIAGTGTPGFSGDAAAATAAQLSLPSGVAIDKSGNVYIADTNNHRIREVSNGTINTIAGDGEELYAGDGGAATSAALDSPTSIAVDTSGNVYIADRLNHAIRIVNTAGTINTFAGTGTASFSGGFSGDGSAPTSAALSKPSGVSLDAAGNLYIADTDNQRIREVGGGAIATSVIATIEGSGSQGYGGDAGLSTAAILNSPRAVAPDALGNLSIADKLNQRIRSGALPTLTFSSEDVGVPSPAQSVTLTNAGTAAITVATITTSTGFTTATGGSCSALPIALSAGASCTENLELLPTAAGPASGSVVFGGNGVVPQSILLTGTATPAPSTVTLTSNVNPALAGQPILYTAVVTPIGLGTPTGTVSFDAGGASFNTQPLAPGSATAQATTPSLPTGADPITAVYSGDANFTGSTSAALPQLVEDFSITLTPQPNNPAGSTNQTVIPGKAVTFDVALTPLLGPFNFPIVLSATGLPPGAIATFSPQTINPGTTPASSTMTIQTAVNQGSLHRGRNLGGGAMAFALLLLPFTRKLRQRAAKLKGLHITTLAVTLLLCAAALGSITGCGADGFFAQPQQNYTLTVTGTTAGSNGYALQHSTTITLTVQ